MPSAIQAGGSEEVWQSISRKAVAGRYEATLETESRCRPARPEREQVGRSLFSTDALQLRASPEDETRMEV